MSQPKIEPEIAFILDRNLKGPGGAVRPGPRAEQHFNNLIDACEEMASAQEVARLVGGVNTARHEAYRQMLARGFRTDIQGVVMSRPNEPGYNRGDVYLIDDWR